MPFEPAKVLVIDEGHASLVAESVVPDGTVGLGLALGSGRRPVVELDRNKGRKRMQKVGRVGHRFGFSDGN